jgi:excisionase family DNA binding protein
MPTLYYSSGQAARELGVTPNQIRTLCESGSIKATRTPGGQWRIPQEELRRLKHEGLPPAARPLPNQSDAAADSGARSRRMNHALLADPSERVIESAEDVLCLQNELKVLALCRQKEEELDWFRDREKEAEQRSSAQHRAEFEQDMQIEAERARQQWEVNWTRFALDRMTPNVVSAEDRLKVYQSVQKTLSMLQLWQPDEIVERVITGAVDKALAPWKRRQEYQSAIERACSTLPADIQRLKECEHLKLRAVESARAAIAELPESAPYGELEVVAVRAMRAIIVAYEHAKACEKIISSAWFLDSTPEEHKQCKEAVRLALESIEVGAPMSQMQEAAERAMAPYREKIAQRERHASNVLIEQIRLMTAGTAVGNHLGHIEKYLERQYEYPKGYTGIVELRKDADQLRKVIRDTLVDEYMAKRDMDGAQIRRRIEELIDEKL